jgi:hypothetical protein
MRRETAKSSVRVLFGVALAVAVAATASAQSLGELAKKEAERRKAIKSSGKVLSGDSIRSVPAPSPATPSPAPAAAGAATGSATTEKPKPEVDRKAQELAWRQRIQGARDSLQRSQMFAEALQSRINGATIRHSAPWSPTIARRRLPSSIG